MDSGGGILAHMARTPRAPEGDGEGAEIISPRGEAIDLGRELGDLAQLADAGDDWRWQVHRLKSAEELARNPRSQPRVWVARLHGPVDLEDFHKLHGGGVYEFWGSQGGTLRTRVTTELEGPPRIVLPEPPKPERSNTPVMDSPQRRRPSRVVRMMVRMLQAQTETMRRLETVALGSTQTRQPESLSELVKSLAALDSLRGARGGESPDADFLDRAMKLFNQGLEIGRTADPTTTREGTDWVRIAEMVVPVVRDTIAQARARKAAATAAPGGFAGAPRPASPPESRAEVVDDAPPTPQGDARVSHRMLTAIEALAGAIASGEEPSDYVATIERILDTQELGMLRLAGTGEAAADAVLARMKPLFASLPILATPEARIFVMGVLEELATGDDES